ncbi:hypothetical protein SLE2022_001680 [Rubroshorea leprosula]
MKLLFDNHIVILLREKLGSKIWMKIDVLRREMKMEEERIEAEKKRVKEEAQQLALIFETVGAFKVKGKGGKGKQISGSVTTQDLVDIIKAQLQRDVDKRIVYLPEIRETGEYIAELKLHPEVTAQFRVNVYAKDKNLFQSCF